MRGAIFFTGLALSNPSDSVALDDLDNLTNNFAQAGRQRSQSGLSVPNFSSGMTTSPSIIDLKQKTQGGERSFAGGTSSSISRFYDDVDGEGSDGDSYDGDPRPIENRTPTPDSDRSLLDQVREASSASPYNDHDQDYVDAINQAMYDESMLKHELVDFIEKKFQNSSFTKEYMENTVNVKTLINMIDDYILDQMKFLKSEVVDPFFSKSKYDALDLPDLEGLKSRILGHFKKLGIYSSDLPQPGAITPQIYAYYTMKFISLYVDAFRQSTCDGMLTLRHKKDYLFKVIKTYFSIIAQENFSVFAVADIRANIGLYRDFINSQMGEKRNSRLASMELGEAVQETAKFRDAFKIVFAKFSMSKTTLSCLQRDTARFFEICSKSSSREDRKSGPREELKTLRENIFKILEELEEAHRTDPVTDFEVIQREVTASSNEPLWELFQALNHKYIHFVTTRAQEKNTLEKEGIKSITDILLARKDAIDGFAQDFKARSPKVAKNYEAVNSTLMPAFMNIMNRYDEAVATKLGSDKLTAPELVSSLLPILNNKDEMTTVFTSVAPHMVAKYSQDRRDDIERTKASLQSKLFSKFETYSREVAGKYAEQRNWLSKSLKYYGAKESATQKTYLEFVSEFEGKLGAYIPDGSLKKRMEKIKEDTLETFSKVDKDFEKTSLVGDAVSSLWPWGGSSTSSPSVPAPTEKTPIISPQPKKKEGWSLWS